MFFNPIPWLPGERRRKGRSSLVINYCPVIYETLNNCISRITITRRAFLTTPPPSSLEHNLGCNSEVKSNSISSHLGINSCANTFVKLVCGGNICAGLSGNPETCQCHVLACVSMLNKSKSVGGRERRRRGKENFCLPNLVDV